MHFVIQRLWVLDELVIEQRDAERTVARVHQVTMKDLFGRVNEATALPPALAPLRQPGSLLAQGGVVTMAGIDDGVVTVDREDLVLQACHE